MSIGYGGKARIVLQDEKTVVYEYSPYNLNEPVYMNKERIYDGLITIKKSALMEPEIHEKMKKMPKVQKVSIVKRIRRKVDYDSIISRNEVCIENSSYCWRFVGIEKNIGMIAMRIVFRIFDEYQEKGILPEVVRLNW